MEHQPPDYVRHDVQELTRTRLCRLEGCGNELDSSDPARGRYANVCGPCRRGETLCGARMKGQGLGQLGAGVAGQGGVAGSGGTGGYPPAPSLPTAAGSLEQKAKAIVPLARKLEAKVRVTKEARKEAAAVVTEFSAALTELRDAAKALIGE